MDGLMREVILCVMVVLTVPDVTAVEWTCSTDVNSTWPSTEALKNFGNTLTGGKNVHPSLNHSKNPEQ